MTALARSDRTRTRPQVRSLESGRGRGTARCLRSRCQRCDSLRKINSRCAATGRTRQKWWRALYSREDRFACRVRRRRRSPRRERNLGAAPPAPNCPDGDHGEIDRWTVRFGDAIIGHGSAITPRAGRKITARASITSREGRIRRTHLAHGAASG